MESPTLRGHRHPQVPLLRPRPSQTTRYVKVRCQDIERLSSKTYIFLAQLYTWVAQERFPLFVKVTRGKFHNLLSTKKLVVIAVLEENKIGELTPEMEEFRDMLHSVIQRDEDGERKYRVKFQFGYTGTPELANSVAMETLSLPNLIVVNSTTYQHHLPDDDPSQLTPEAIKIFLDEVLDGSAPVYGGSTYTMRYAQSRFEHEVTLIHNVFCRLYRAYYEAKSSFIEMWRGNPALTAVLFGLPMGFFSLICYSICCADIMDAEEEDDDGDDLGKFDSARKFSARL